MEHFQNAAEPVRPRVDWHRLQAYKLQRTPPYTSWQVWVPLPCDSLTAMLLKLDVDEHDLEELFDETVFEADERFLAESDAGPIGLRDPEVTRSVDGIWFGFELEMPDSELAGRHGRWVRETVDRAIARMVGRMLVMLDSPDAAQLKTALRA